MYELDLRKTWSRSIKHDADFRSKFKAKQTTWILLRERDVKNKQDKREIVK